MPRGTIEVLLVSAKGLENTDFLNDMDPYVILICRSQEQKSSVASGKGTQPEWNESFVFTISDGASELTLKIMDSDTGSADDIVGEATVPLEPLFLEGSLPPTAYNVVKDQEFRGEIRVGLTFTPEERHDREFRVEEETYGGWKQSAYTD
ncbi:elicitor-responsive protein 3 [Quercus robur]|uniref:C2 domain-containing protein n=1 Tax=Quercus lobata TaxID=97700 RepID=A0A7N2N5G7_QUELO|nr:elicitor-responsive protein 3 isoform X1 [Quercus lobata]XP_030945474.1 elicitor-responsive protein 3 isoform X2 [Quercus lobata]XP_050265841.1 elicitor-responsive protein 3 [Quercus robur]